MAGGGTLIASSQLLQGVVGVELSLGEAAAPKEWCCIGCGSKDPRLAYRSGSINRCFTCQGYKNMEINSGQKAKKLAGLTRSVEFSLEEFLTWASSNPRVCSYCEITDEGLWLLDLRTANGKRNEALGIDRINGDLYSLDNIAWCCYPCNRSKGNYLDSDEMRLLAPVLRGIWQKRLAKIYKS